MKQTMNDARRGFTMNDDHSLKLLKLPRRSKKGLKHVVFTAKIDDQGKYYPVSSDSLPSKIQAASNDKSINTVVIADGHDTTDLKKLGLEEYGKIRSSDIPDSLHSFYHFSGDNTPRPKKFFLIRAKSYSDACHKLDVLEKWRSRGKNFWHIVVFIVFLQLLIAISAGLAYWGYNREMTYYFADYVDEFGIPKGRFPLKKKDIAKRSGHYRFVFKQNKLQQVIHANSSGQPTPIRYTEFLDRPMIQRLIYVENGQNKGKLNHIEYLDRNDNVQLRLVYSGNDFSIIDFEEMTHRNEITQTGLTANTTSLYSGMFVLEKSSESKNNIQRWAVRRNDLGQIIQVEYRGIKGMVPISDAEGVFGLEYELDVHGRVTEMWYLDQDAKRWATKSGVAGRRYEYQGTDMIRCEYVDIHGNPALNERGIAISERKFDRFGNVVEERYLDVVSYPCLRIYGYAKRIMKYDERGNPIEEAYFGIDGKPCLNKYGDAKMSAKYDERGNKIEQAHFGIDDKLCLIKDGYAKVTMKYDDERGNIIEQVYFGIDDKLCLNKDGYAKVTLKYDERGNIIEQAYFGIDGRPCIHENGGAKMTWAYDKRGNRIEQAFFGIDGKPYINKDGYAKVTMKYDDERGNPIEAAYFGIDGKPCLIHDGYAKVTWAYGEQGNIIEQAYFGIDGNPTALEGDDPYDCLKITYHKNGMVATKTWFYRVKEHPEGYTKETWAYDERGNVIEKSYFGIDDKPTALEGDNPYDSLKITYHESDKIATLTLCYRAKEHPHGYAKMAMKYDERGNPIEGSFFGVDGKPMALVGDDPYDSLKKTYHDNGEIATQTWLYHVKEHPNGYAKMTRVYDNRGNPIELAYFGIDGNPTALEGDDPYDSLKITYHENGMVATLTSFYHAKEHPDGYAKKTTKLDEQGNLIEVACFGIDDQPCLHMAGYAKKTTKCDGRGKPIEQTYYGIDGKPCLIHDGYAKVTMKYDEQGNVIEESYLGIDGKPCLIHDGYAKVTWSYDERGNKIEEAYFGIDDKPCFHKDGGAKVTYAYDEQGNKIEEAYFGIDGRPYLHSDGTAKVTVKYDEHGNKIEEAYYGVDGNPTSLEGDDPYDSLKITYHENDVVATLTSFYRVEKHPNGYTSKEFKFDPNGNLIDEIYCDAEGKQLENPHVEEHP